MLRGARYNERTKVDNGDYSDLPPPALNAKTIHLAPEKEAQSPLYKLREMPIRQCLLKYAKEGEKERSGYYGGSRPDPDSRKHVKSKTPVLGSDDRDVRTNGSYGFFSCILEAYNNHWTLRTCVDDWWYTIIRRIALAIDNNSKSKQVRKFFVSHEGKKKLTVVVGPDIYGVDYSWFLDQMTKQISENINVPNYVDLLKADFSTSTKTHAIVSEITVMASVQEYFEYEMQVGCGIPSLQMEGEEEDWKRMKTKFLQLKKLLKPIHKNIGLEKKWWNGVEGICEHLIKAFDGKPDVNWWTNILTYKEGWGLKGSSGNGQPDSWDGWFISELLGLYRVESLETLNNNGVTTVPMTITHAETGQSEESAFAAGIAGFEMFKEEDSPWPSVKAVHGWALMLEPNSVFRADLNKWESQLTKGA